MSNQEPKDQSNTTEKSAVNKKRRFILGAGAVAPVALTLVSPSVFGVECLSQQMSGNTSHHGTGSCNLGSNPQFWRDNPDLWPSGFNFGDEQTCSTYTNGTQFNAANAFSSDAITTKMAEILCTSISTTEANFVAALLNAQTVGYVMTAPEVIELRAAFVAGTCPGPSCTSMPPGYGTVDAFLESTWAP